MRLARLKRSAGNPYAYESRFRSVWDRQEETTLVVVLRAPRSDVEALPFDLLQEAKRHCDSMRPAIERKYCHLYADILVVNRLSEGEFLDRSEKYRIMNKYRDYRKQIGKELLYKYAEIVAEFKISGELDASWLEEELPPNQKLAAGIGDFCTEFSNRSKMSWQSCVGAVVWFIGISQPETD